MFVVLLLSLVAREPPEPVTEVDHPTIDTTPESVFEVDHAPAHAAPEPAIAADHPTIGGMLDVLGGQTFTARDRDVLPSGHNLSEAADLWFAGVVNQTASDGGTSTFDPMRLSSQGRSWTLLRHSLNGVAMDDPGRPGSPVIDLPYSAWQTLTYRSLWTARPGFDATMHALPGDARDGVWVRGSYGGEIGGPELIPRNFMNRDPATDWGASPVRRSVHGSREFEAQATAGGDWYGVRLYYEHRGQDNRYPTLVSDVTGQRLNDSAQRDTLMAVSDLRLGRLPLTIIAAYQSGSRSNEGAEFRLPDFYTQSTRSHAYLTQISTVNRLSQNAIFDVAVSASYRDDNAIANSSRPLVTDIENQWMWLSQPTPPQHLTRTSVDLATGIAWSGQTPIDIRLTGSQAFLRRRQSIASDITATTYERSAVDPAQTMTLYEPGTMGEEYLRSLRLEGNAERTLAGFTMRAMIALDHGAAGTDVNHVSFWNPAFGVAATRPMGGGHIFALLRHEPDTLTAQVSQFLNGNLGNGRTYTWNDNGDGVPSANEAGSLLSRTGGRYHTVSDHLKRPTSNQFAIGWQTPRFGPFRAVVTGELRYQFNAFVARMSGPAAASYQLTSFRDPGGDGRGENQAAGGGQILDAYGRIPGTEGQEIYQLQNRTRDNHFIGSEIQLVSVASDDETERRIWFMNLSLAGYYDIGSGTFGSGPDRNDPGIINESTADPNSRVNERGRFDHDRAFSIKMLAGVEPIPGLTISGTVRYRDGQPFSRIVVNDDLPQGATPIMATWRGAARYTFAMTTNLKVRWASHIGALQYAVTGEIYNLFQQSLELIEDPRTGATFRRALEMTPGRTGFVTLELGI